MSSFELERLDEDPERVPARPAEQAQVDLRTREVLHVQRGAGNQAVARMLARQRLLQRDDVDGVDVNRASDMPSWDYDGKTYHLNNRTDPPHITEEGRDTSRKAKGGKEDTTKNHYFFTAELTAKGWTIKNAVSGQRGKKKFSELPAGLQAWFTKNYDKI